jgi:hypothetical protein
MENMKINSKNEYKRDRVISGNAPHAMLKMIQEEAMGKVQHKIDS